MSALMHDNLRNASFDLNIEVVDSPVEFVQGFQKSFLDLGVAPKAL